MSANSADAFRNVSKNSPESLFLLFCNNNHKLGLLNREDSERYLKGHAYRRGLQSGTGALTGLAAGALASSLSPLKGLSQILAVGGAVLVGATIGSAIMGSLPTIQKKNNELQEIVVRNADILVSDQALNRLHETINH